MPNIINNLFSRLDQENTPDGKLRITFKKSDVRFFSKPDSKKCEINLNLTTTEETNPNLVLIKQYLVKRLEPSSNLRDAKLRFDKLDLANRLLELLRQPTKNILKQLTTLYVQGVELDGDATLYGIRDHEFHYSLPRGELGDVLIKIQKAYDPAFKLAYETSNEKMSAFVDALANSTIMAN